MLSDQEQEVLKEVIRNGRIDIFSVLISKKVFEDYNISTFRKQNYYQFGIGNIPKIIENIGVELMEKDDTELKKTILGLYISLGQAVQRRNMNE